MLINYSDKPTTKKPFSVIFLSCSELYPMKQIFKNSVLAFLARLAIICNVFFILSLMIMLLKWFKLPAFLANFIAVLGLEMSPVANISFGIWILGMKFTRQSVNIPNWQTIVIVFMLLLQIIAAFI